APRRIAERALAMPASLAAPTEASEEEAPEEPVVPPRRAVVWNWANRGGLAVHPTRSVVVAAGPRLPALAPVVVAEAEAELVIEAPGVPALAAPEPWPTFASLEPLMNDTPSSPGSRSGDSRVPLLADRPAADAADDLTRFLMATAPGTWADAPPVARTAETADTVGTVRQ
ncbi:MAG: hypothetical protein AAF907_08575, partial [Planctomycetota bacterium]